MTDKRIYEGIKPGDFDDISLEGFNCAQAKMDGTLPSSERVKIVPQAMKNARIDLLSVFGAKLKSENYQAEAEEQNVGERTLGQLSNRQGVVRANTDQSNNSGATKNQPSLSKQSPRYFVGNF